MFSLWAMRKTHRKSGFFVFIAVGVTSYQVFDKGENKKILLYGFGEYAKGLFQEYDVPWSEIGVIVDQTQQTLEKEALAGEFRSLEKTKAMLGRHQGLDDSEKIQTISWEDFIKNRRSFNVEYAVIGTILYEREVRKKLLEGGAFSEEKILRINEWICQFPKTGRGQQKISTLNERGWRNKR